MGFKDALLGKPPKRIVVNNPQVEQQFPKIIKILDDVQTRLGALENLNGGESHNQHSSTPVQNLPDWWGDMQGKKLEIERIKRDDTPVTITKQGKPIEQKPMIRATSQDPGGYNVEMGSEQYFYDKCEAIMGNMEDESIYADGIDDVEQLGESSLIADVKSLKDSLHNFDSTSAEIFLHSIIEKLAHFLRDYKEATDIRKAVDMEYKRKLGEYQDMMVNEDDTKDRLELEARKLTEKIVTLRNVLNTMRIHHPEIAKTIEMIPILKDLTLDASLETDEGLQLKNKIENERWEVIKGTGIPAQFFQTTAEELKAKSREKWKGTHDARVIRNFVRMSSLSKGLNDVFANIVWLDLKREFGLILPEEVSYRQFCLGEGAKLEEKTERAIEKDEAKERNKEGEEEKEFDDEDVEEFEKIEDSAKMGGERIEKIEDSAKMGKERMIDSLIEKWKNKEEEGSV